MHLARGTRTQRWLDSAFDTPNPNTLHGRAVDLHRFSDVVVGQPWPSLPSSVFNRMRACIKVRAEAFPFENDACNCARSSDVNLTLYTFMASHFTGTCPLGDPAMNKHFSQSQSSAAHPPRWESLRCPNCT